jgi:hypothetical protein
VKNTVHINRFKPFLTRTIKPPTPEQLHELLQNIDPVHPVEDLIPDDIPPNIIDNPKPELPVEAQQSTSTHRDSKQTTMTIPPNPDEDSFIVDKVVGKRQKADGSWEYSLKWKGVSSAHNTCEPYENLNSTLKK